MIGRDKGAETAVKPLRDKGRHVELVPGQPTAMHTLREAFSRAHFSQILVRHTSWLRDQLCWYELPS